MPFLTPHYALNAFGFGDIFSASADQRRFLIMDQQMAFISDLIGDGRTSGWNVSVVNESTRELSVSEGEGIINKFVIRTFAPLDFTVSDNKTSFVYMRRKNDVIGGFSDFSNLGSLEHTDSSAPTTPSGFSISGIEFNELFLDWSDNSEADFSHYIIQRSLNNINFDDIAESSVSSYLDTDVEQDTIYYYKIVAVDVTGNKSSASSTISAKTLRDLRVPVNGSIFQSFSGNEKVQLLWEPSPSANLDRYEIRVQELDTGYNPVGSARIIEVNTDKTLLVVRNLKNKVGYKFSLFTVTTNEVFSEELSLIDVPQFNSNPDEVTDITITYEQGLTDDVNIVANIKWSPVDDPYVVFPDKFFLTFVENGVSFSEPITVNGQFNTSIDLLPFKDESGSVAFRAFKPNTIYLLRIQTVDERNNVSSGVIARTRTPVFRPIAPPNDPQAFQQDDLSIVGLWTNSSSEFFSHNLLSITRTELDNGNVTTILDKENVGASSSYRISEDLFAGNSEYEFVLIAVDNFGNESIPITFVFQSVSSSDVAAPLTPRNIELISGNSSVTLLWEKSTNIFVTSYKIYRAPFQFFLDASSFELIDTVPIEITTYIDYEVENDLSYAYILSSVDLFGRESTNPVENPEDAFGFQLGFPKETEIFDTPENTSVSASGFDAVITWDVTPGSFNGYEVWRSVGNKFSFVLAGSVGPDDTTFTDEDILLEGGITYYYIVRAFRNESQLFITESTAVPQGSIVLAKVVVANGTITVDETVAREIKNLDATVREETIKEIKAHKHTLDDSGVDRRIDLKSDIFVTDWTTENFQRYTTEVDISGATSYNIKINGTVNEDFFKNSKGEVDQVAVALANAGKPAILSEVDGTDGIITFEVPLFSEAVEAPYSDEPTLEVELLGISEVFDILPESKLAGISAAQIQSGVLAESQLPVIKHEGRIAEELIPAQISTTTDDNFVYTLESADENLGEAITFYDIIPFVRTDELFAATSNGVLLSTDFGATWTNKFSTSTAPLKLLFSSTLSKFFIFTNKRAFATLETLESINEIAGLENIKTIRDVIEDDAGNLYCSTDLGVYKLDKDKISNFFSWEQSALFGAKSTEAYALLFDTNSDRIIVSNEFGILESTNQGQNWSLTSEFESRKKIFQFVQDQKVIFALTPDEIWRKKTTDSAFVRVFDLADLGVEASRKMVVFNERLYLTTDVGILASAAQDDIHNDSVLNIDHTLPKINVNNMSVPVHSLDIIENQLLIGTDQRLFILDTDGSFWIQHDNMLGKVPSVFVDKKLQKIGLRYNNSAENKNISFDERLAFDAVVSVANQYKKYEATQGGWSFQRFDAALTLKVNNAVKATSGDIALDISQFTDFVFPVYSERNAHVVGADKYKLAAENDIARLTGIVNGDEGFALEDGELLSDVVASTMANIERFLSQLFPEARVVEITDSEGNTTEEVVAFPAILHDLTQDEEVVGSLNISDGIIEFVSSFNKLDILHLDIRGVTIKNIGETSHGETEDTFELVNSGLPSSLSQAQQANIVKAGIFNEKKYPGEQDDLSTPVQATYIVPRDSNWYDTLNSTVDYTLQKSNDNIGLSLPYAAGVLFVEATNRVLVGGSGGLLSINVANLDIDEVVVDATVSNIRIKQLKLIQGDIYAVTEKNIYRSIDNGATWVKLDRTGLPNELFSIAFVNNVFVVGGEDGIYFEPIQQDLWRKALDSDDPVEVMIDPDFVFAIVGKKLYFSADGINFLTNAEFTFDINELAKFQSVAYAGTNEGLKKDDGSFYAMIAGLSLANILDDSVASNDVIVNSLFSDTDRLIIGLSDGRYVVFDGDDFNVKSDSNLDSIHNILVVNDDIWLFGFDGFKIPSLDYIIRLSTGVPV